MTKRLASACALLLTLSAGAPRPATPFWQKSWTVSAVTGPTAAEWRAEMVGKPVTLTADRAQTPYSEPCPQAPDYRDVRARPRAGIGRHFGPHWRFPAALGARPVYGWVRCPGAGNIGALAFKEGGEGYYFFEDGLVLTLR